MNKICGKKFNLEGIDECQGYFNCPYTYRELEDIEQALRKKAFLELWEMLDKMSRNEVTVKEVEFFKNTCIYYI